MDGDKCPGLNEVTKGQESQVSTHEAANGVKQGHMLSQ